MLQQTSCRILPCYATTKTQYGSTQEPSVEHPHCCMQTAECTLVIRPAASRLIGEVPMPTRVLAVPFSPADFTAMGDLLLVLAWIGFVAFTLAS